ncbi:hypothetical protein HRbin04_01338 [archaeon HR04]|nr:hypothetical protein HRbin04_01338 [archaeon HR04]
MLLPLLLLLDSTRYIMRSFSASTFAILKPIPIAALSTLFGSIPLSLLTEPFVSLASGSGSTIMLGLYALKDGAMLSGTATYTRSAPLLYAASAAKSGAPWYILLPPTINTTPLSPFFALLDLAGINCLT